MTPDPSLEPVLLNHLGELTLRGHVAYAVRCGRRVLALLRLPADYPRRDETLASLVEALRLAESVARGETVGIALLEAAAQAAFVAADTASDNHGFGGFGAAHAARCATLVVRAETTGPDASFREALASAFGAGRVLQSNCGIFAEEFVRRALRADFDALVRLRLGEGGAMGTPIDPSEGGPLGPLWPAGVPAWYRPTIS